MSSEGARPTVAVVDDERGIAEAYSYWLSDEYDVRTATSGAAALETIDEDVDVVLLDRRMPDRSGDEVLDRVRERGLDCRVAMVTAVYPDFDVTEMAFDAYLTKPVSKDELFETVEQLLLLEDYSDRSRAAFRAAAKLGALRAEKTEEELAESDRFRALEREFERLRAEEDAVVQGMDEATLTAALREVTADE